MWYSKSKCQKIKALVKASHKWFKIILVLGVKNFDLAFIVLKLVEFSFFNNFFFDLAKFQNLDVFLLFNFSDFLAFSIPFLPILNLLTSLLLSFFLKAYLLSLFLLKADLLPSILPRASLLDNSVIFSIVVNGATILLKL